MNPGVDEALAGEALSATRPYVFARSSGFVSIEPAGIVLYLFSTVLSSALMPAAPDPSLPAKDWPIPPMDKEAGYKPSAFTWAMGRLILQRMADRETMKAITADPRMPAYCTVFTWVKRVPEFGEAYRQVRDALAAVKREEAEGQRAAAVRAKAATAIAAGKRPRDWVSGRASTYSPEVAADLCLAIEDGASLSEVVRRPGMPSFKAVYTWLRRRPDFAAMYVEACRRRELGYTFQVHMIADRAIDMGFLADLPSLDREIRAVRGRAGRVRPRLYRWVGAKPTPLGRRTI